MFGDDAPPPEAQRTLGVRPTGPAFLQPDYAPGDLSLASDGQVKGGTLAALVEKLTSHEGVDHHFNTTFLLTYRTFTTSNDLFDMLVQRYMIEMPAGLAAEEAHIWTEQKQKLVRIRVLNILKVWIESNLYDDNESAVLDRVSRFATEAVTDSVAAKQVIRVVERRLQNGVPSLAAPLTSYGPPPPPIISRSIRKLKFLDMDPTELARQLTLYDSRLFSAIRPPECLAKAWPKKVQTDSPNIRAMIDLSNAITRWVGCTILEYQDPKKRVGVVKHFVNIAERCRQLQNFSTVMHIIAGLNSTPIYRLKRTWEIVPQKTVNTLAALNELMKPNKNFGDYRDAVRTIGPPCVPFLGVYLTDWTFIGDGNPDFLREKPDQINFAKRQKAGELIQQVQLHQSTPYNLQEVPSFLKYLEEQFNLADRDEQELYELSMALEPRERDDERVARMLNESGERHSHVLR
ncbi:uncharacterized protein L969DRAFT_49135 [Mixia osmundae IAM 14324]|uniref:uncharacterized protein n=1 Tax=Mixia osmundae (strain CBS 9802 / IAM 14324 / JCM 22182 / KY 12970) TaxID=764103 RepID=UPI0004A5534A|nr:uncharacterized protein L969DRAFT_49135 [Mixia osmundae IAM 14324]KEI39358.1 hypothetical protein L969DRAFT_49135 [Mixia osmundae IAM 14324]